MKFEWDERKNQINLIKHGIVYSEPDEQTIRIISFMQSLLSIRKKRMEGRSTIPALNIYKRYGIE